MGRRNLYSIGFLTLFFTLLFGINTYAQSDTQYYHVFAFVKNADLALHHLPIEDHELHINWAVSYNRNELFFEIKNRLNSIKSAEGTVSDNKIACAYLKNAESVIRLYNIELIEEALSSFSKLTDLDDAKKIRNNYVESIFFYIGKSEALMSKD